MMRIIECLFKKTLTVISSWECDLICKLSVEAMPAFTCRSKRTMDDDNFSKLFARGNEIHTSVCLKCLKDSVEMNDVGAITRVGGKVVEDLEDKLKKNI
jgi:hypothetical protein